MPRGTQDSDPVQLVSRTGLSPSMVGFPNTIPLQTVPCYLSYNPVTTEAITVWAPPLSLATTHGIVSSPPGTEMFQFPEFPAHWLCVHQRLTRHSPGRVSPFGYLRIFALAQLPVAFRSATRPSSALDAKASPVCP